LNFLHFQHDLEGQHVAMSTVSNFIVADGEDEATWHVELEGGKEAAFQIRIHGI
jgi:hypothetical protein